MRILIEIPVIPEPVLLTIVDIRLLRMVRISNTTQDAMNEAGILPGEAEPEHNEPSSCRLP